MGHRGDWHAKKRILSSSSTAQMLHAKLLRVYFGVASMG